ncbi:hypothetical protein PR202_gb02667 [Eleusine coracana subsp. coracana]|uniref:Uncharacterized protein n=1 Tax=Eleusine coracana subsp. coracana TaxID=191504 RepID=A0AAV5DYA4_ELECO|nr:hypothetical protein PR202_gb02667 [Eleusine coracana subsp. coracana]
MADSEEDRSFSPSVEEEEEEEAAASSSPLLVPTTPVSSQRRPLLLNPAYARCKSVIHDELRNFRVFLQWCLLDHTTGSSRAASYAAFLTLSLLVPAAVSLSLRADPSLSPSSASAITFNRVAQLPATGLAAISFLTLAAFFRRLGGLRPLLFLDGGLRHDTAFVRRGYARELDRAFRLLAALLLPSFCAEAAHKTLLFFCTVHVDPPPVPFLPRAGGGTVVLPWRGVALVATLASWVYRTGVFLLVCVLFRLTCELQILRFEGIHRMLDVEARAAARRSTPSTAAQLGALLVALASRDAKSFANTGDLLVGSAVQLSGFFMCLFGAARITHRAQRVVSIASQWHMNVVCLQHGNKTSPASDTDHHAYGLSSLQDDDDGAECSYQSRQALVTYLCYNGGGITLFGFTLDRGLLHTIFVFEMTLVLWILSKVVLL